MSKQQARQMEYTSQAGNKYTFQKVKPSKWLEMLDKSDATGTRNRVVFYSQIIENIVAIPGGLTIDAFDEDERGGVLELDEIVQAAARFQQGK